MFPEGRLLVVIVPGPALGRPHRKNQVVQRRADPSDWTLHALRLQLLGSCNQLVEGTRRIRREIAPVPEAAGTGVELDSLYLAVRRVDHDLMRPWEEVVKLVPDKLVDRLQPLIVDGKIGHLDSVGSSAGGGFRCQLRIERVCVPAPDYGLDLDVRVRARPLFQLLPEIRGTRRDVGKRPVNLLRRPHQGDLCVRVADPFRRHQVDALGNRHGAFRFAGCKEREWDDQPDQRRDCTIVKPLCHSCLLLRYVYRSIRFEMVLGVLQFAPITALVGSGRLTSCPLSSPSFALAVRLRALATARSLHSRQGRATAHLCMSHAASRPRARCRSRTSRDRHVDDLKVRPTLTGRRLGARPRS